jgi:hypothetical protein
MTAAGDHPLTAAPWCTRERNRKVPAFRTVTTIWRVETPVLIVFQMPSAYFRR